MTTTIEREATTVVYIKLRSGNEKRWSFLTSSGGTTYLRIHAARFASAEKAQALIDANKDDNPGFEWRVTK
jgi:hypothetical protein